MINPTTKDLKPCPFCGNHSTLRIYYEPEVPGNYAEYYLIECLTCDFMSSGMFGTYEDIVDWWNKRPAEEEIARLREEVHSLASIITI